MELPIFPLDKPLRLAIMLILDKHSKIIFTDLARALRISKGALEHHLRSLEKEGYISRESTFINSSPRVQVVPTLKGLDGFRQAKDIWLKLFMSPNDDDAEIE